MRVGIVAQQGNERAAGIAGKLRESLDATVLIDPTTAESLDVEATPLDAFPDADLVVSIGGDGTFLYAAHAAGSTPIVGVNLGEVGFLNAIAPDDAVEAVSALVEAVRGGDLPTRERVRVVASGGETGSSGDEPADDGGGPATAVDSDWRLDPAVNEVVVQAARRGRGGGAHLDVRVDGEPYFEGRADGVIVATPTGSTAYNLSEGGPLVAPGVDALVVTDMCAREGRPPLLVPDDATITVQLDAPGVTVADGRVSRGLDAGECVRIDRADEPLRIAGGSLDFFRGLDKLD